MRTLLKLAPPLVAALVATVAAAPPPVRGVRPSPPRLIRVLVITDGAAEAQPWLDRYALVASVAVPGLSPAHPEVRCGDTGVCLLVTGPGKAGAAASVAALVLSEQLDLSSAWFLVAGLAAIDPAEGTVGTVAWATHAVDFGISWEIDARALPPGWSTGYLGILTKSPSDVPSPTFGTEVYQPDPVLVAKALALSATAALEDGAAARTYRANYAAPPATLPPRVITCATATSDTRWHGELLGLRAREWSSQNTGGAGRYCTSQQTANASIAALHRGGTAGLLDPARIAALHAAYRFDRQYPGQAAADSLAADAGGLAIAIDNLLIAGAPLVDDIVARWDAWQAGVPR